jgi:hypothetical protein
MLCLFGAAFWSQRFGLAFRKLFVRQNPAMPLANVPLRHRNILLQFRSDFVICPAASAKRIAVN